MIQVTRNVYITFTHYLINEEATMPGEDIEPPSELKFIYKKADGYKIHFANGVIGGFTPHGDLVCNFFFEYQEIPNEVEANIKDNQVVPVEKEESVPVVYTREMVSGIILSPQEVINLYKWLDRKIKEFDEKFSSGDDS